MSVCINLVFSTVVEMVTTPIYNPLRALKWSFPLLWCFLAFCYQSVMLHQTTITYVIDQDKTVLEDAGHYMLGQKVVPMTMLDMISFSSMNIFILGTGLIKDLRLWAKVFFCCGFLFFSKGSLDYLTAMPDSIGWATCKARLQPATIDYMRGFEGLNGTAYWSRLFELEVHGVDGVWPVRYCADMLLSGHTFVMFLFLLGFTDLVRRISALHKGNMWVFALEVIVNILVICCACADLYLIVVNHFHYTVDVILALFMTLLFYTNAGISILVDAWVEVWEDGVPDDNFRYTQDQGNIWIPPLLIPCCWFQGFYKVQRLDDGDVRLAVRSQMPRAVKEACGSEDDDESGDYESGSTDEESDSVKPSP